MASVVVVGSGGREHAIVKALAASTKVSTVFAAPGNGGAVHLTGAGSGDVTGTEVSGNTASAEGGGLWNSASGTFTVTGSDIVVDGGFLSTTI